MHRAMGARKALVGRQVTLITADQADHEMAKHGIEALESFRRSPDAIILQHGVIRDAGRRTRPIDHNTPILGNPADRREDPELSRPG